MPFFKALSATIAIAKPNIPFYQTHVKLTIMVTKYLHTPIQCLSCNFHRIYDIIEIDMFESQPSDYFSACIPDCVLSLWHV